MVKRGETLDAIWMAQAFFREVLEDWSNYLDGTFSKVSSRISLTAIPNERITQTPPVKNDDEL